MQKCAVKLTYSCKKVRCDGCNKKIHDLEAFVYHCPDGKSSYRHRKGYDLCLECGDKQLQFDELRGLLDSVKDYKLERNEQYPVRVTLQYYKATSNGVVDKEIMDDIVKQLEQSQKQADFMGSLVTEYDPKRPTEWVEKDDEKIDGAQINQIAQQLNGIEVVDDFAQIRAALLKYCSSEWEQCLKNFQNEDVKDKDLKFISDEDLKELIPKMGPRNRFKNWLKSFDEQK